MCIYKSITNETFIIQYPRSYVLLSDFREDKHLYPFSSFDRSWEKLNAKNAGIRDVFLDKS